MHSSGLPHGIRRTGFLFGRLGVYADKEVAHATPSQGPDGENPFLETVRNPLSTFSIDVDRASYSNVRRFLTGNQRPPRDAVRIEEMVNYFSYDYPDPSADQPFSLTTEIAECPWNEKNRLLLIGLQGRRIDTAELPPANLVFLIDVSGSMQFDNKLPLVKSAMHLLVDQLRPQDRVAIVAYAGSAGLVLPSTDGGEKGSVHDAIERNRCHPNVLVRRRAATSRESARRSKKRTGLGLEPSGTFSGRSPLSRERSLPSRSTSSPSGRGLPLRDGGLPDLDGAHRYRDGRLRHLGWRLADPDRNLPIQMAPSAIRMAATPIQIGALPSS